MTEKTVKVLCPTDGSKSSEKAIKFAINMANNFSNVELSFILISSGDDTATDIAYRGAQVIRASQVQ